MNKEDELRYNSLRRFQKDALEKAASVYAFCKAPLRAGEPLVLLYDYQVSHLSTSLHEFSFYARKTIELADDTSPGIIGVAKAAKLASAGRVARISGNDVALSCESFWWILSRMVHSRQSDIIQATDSGVDVNGQTASFVTPKFLAFRSDFDPDDKINFIVIEELLECFLVHLELPILEALSSIAFAAPKGDIQQGSDR